MAEGSSGPGPEGARLSTASKFDRRSFMKMGAAAGLAVGAATVLAPEIAAAQTRTPTAKPPEKLTTPVPPKNAETAVQATPATKPSQTVAVTTPTLTAFQKEQQAVQDAWEKDKNVTATAVTKRETAVATQQAGRATEVAKQAAKQPPKQPSGGGGLPVGEAIAWTGGAALLDQLLLKGRIRKGIGSLLDKIRRRWAGSAPSAPPTAVAAPTPQVEVEVPFELEGAEVSPVASTSVATAPATSPAAAPVPAAEATVPAEEDELLPEETPVSVVEEEFEPGGEAAEEDFELPPSPAPPAGGSPPADERFPIS